MGIGYLVTVLASSVTAVTITPALCALLLPYGNLPDTEPWVARYFKGLYNPLLMIAMRRGVTIIAAALFMTVASFSLFPSFGRIFLPEFQEQTMVNTLMLFPGASLEATNRSAFVIEEALKNDDRFDYIQLRSGRALGDGDAAGVNLAHLDVGISDKGMKIDPMRSPPCEKNLPKFLEQFQMWVDLFLTGWTKFCRGYAVRSPLKCLVQI